MYRFIKYPELNRVFADTYVYRGPVKHFDNIIESTSYYETTANTRAKAISNLKFKIKQAHGYSKYAKITIDEDLVDNVSELSSMPAMCPKCNVRLTDGGYCPKCGEYYGD